MDFFSYVGNWFRQAKPRNFVPEQWTSVIAPEATQRALLENNKEWVFIAVDKIAKSVASVRFKVMRYKANGDDQEQFDGDMVDFLERPSPNFTGKDFIYLNTVYKELTGNSFWEIIKKRQINPLIPTKVDPVIDGGKIKAFKYNDGVNQRTIDADKVLHDRYVDPAKPHWGIGKLAKIARWVDTSSYANEFLRLFFVNGAQFGGFIETEEESEERIKLIKLGLANDHVGVQNAHKMAVLPKGSKFSPATASMSDMQFRELDEQYRDKILAGFGVPKTLVGLTTEVNRASAEASEYVFAKYTVKPAVDDLVEFLNVSVAPLFDPSGKLYFAYDEFVPVNMEIALKEREIALNRQPYKTVNEVRAELGLPKVQGGDAVYGSPLQVPLGTPALEISPPDQNDEEDEPKKAVPMRARGELSRERLISSIITKATEVISAHHDPDAEAHKSFVARVEAHENLLADKVRDFNNRQQRDVLQNLNRITKDVSKTDLFDMDAEVSVLVDFVEPMLRGLFLEQAIEEYLAQGFGGTLDQDRPAIKRVIELAAKRLSRSYNNTTATLLKVALNDGIAAGDDFTKLAVRVQEVYAYSDQVRALAVAKTESFYIANAASKEAYRQSGVVKSIRWYTSEDERVCEFCGPMDGRVVEITKTFFNKDETVVGRDGGKLSTSYRAIDVPPLHTNCRCFVRAETIDVS